IAAMFMERQPGAPAGAQAATSTAPVAPAPASSRRASGRLSGSGSAAATAVAVRAPTSPLVKEKAAEAAEPQMAIGWTSWLALGACAVGTLLMGTVLAYWLVNLAQFAAGIMMRVM